MDQFARAPHNVERLETTWSLNHLRLAPGAAVALFIGCGLDDETVRYWCMSGSAVCNNSGDTVFLRDPNGNIAASLSYGESG